MSRRKGDIVDVIEAAYRVELPKVEWLEGLATAARPLIDDGFGVNAYLFDRLPGGGVMPHSPVLVGDDIATSLAVFGALAEATAANPEMIANLHVGVPCGTVSTFAGPEWSRTTEGRISRFGVRDMLGIIGSDPTGFGCAISAPRRRVTRIGKARTERWEKIAAHIAAAYRLRRQLTTREESPEPPDAVLSPTGALQHAVEAAKGRDSRAALRDAAVALDRARGALRRKDPDGAVHLWKGLVDGQWTLVDHFDSDGRRFLLARRNDPDARRHEGLTLRERQVLGYRALGHPLKLIAYELGLSSATISADLTRAMKALGLRSQADVARLVGPVEPGSR
jgi:DNA-binding CsgD family transcriptional regulator